MPSVHFDMISKAVTSLSISTAFSPSVLVLQEDKTLSLGMGPFALTFGKFGSGLWSLIPVLEWNKIPEDAVAARSLFKQYDRGFPKSKHI